MLETTLTYSITAIIAYLALRLAIDLIQRLVSGLFHFLRRRTIRIRFNAYLIPYKLKWSLQAFLKGIWVGIRRLLWCAAWPFAKLAIAILPAPVQAKPQMKFRTVYASDSSENINKILEKPTFIRKGIII
ncbi:hypothetical protein [Photobacterium ganghwense]|uniref:hypothetical protein n=1 Tax=Photobacterium ganghwense TaxID=320778 RepID=UPI001A8FC810|nr:hypothetical protein [Photobacterium ganghwense]QSV17611.1 hypothetical protein FH974_25305 [Photobacterium ganghwense]